MPDRESAVLPVQESLLVWIKAWPGFAALLKGDKAFLRSAEENTPLPYVIVGQVTAPDLNEGHLMQPGQRVLVALHCWGLDIGEATDVWQELYRCLHAKVIPLQGHTMLRGSLGYVSDIESQTRQAYQVDARYTARAQMAAA